MITRRHFTSGLVAGAALTGVGLRPASAQGLVLQYANASNAQNITNQFIARFGEKLSKRTGGAISIESLLNMGSEQSIMEGVSLGTLDMAMSGYTGLPEFDVFYTPYLLDDIPHGVRVFNGPLGEKAAAALASTYNMKLLGVGSTGPFVLAAKEPISDWADLKGRKIRVPPFASYTQCLEALGAIPTPVPFNEIYSALQQGVVDGVVTVLNVLVVNKFLEVCKYCVRNDFGVGLDKFVISNASWDRLDAEMQRIFTETFAEMQQNDWVPTTIKNAEQDFKSWEEINGAGTVLTLDPKPIREIMTPIGEASVTKLFGADSFKLIKEA